MLYCEVINQTRGWGNDSEIKTEENSKAEFFLNPPSNVWLKSQLSQECRMYFLKQTDILDENLG